MRRRVFEIEIILLNVFALISRNAVEPFFQNRVFAVPQTDGKTEMLFAVADSGNAVFVPSEGFQMRLLERKIIPRRAVKAIIFADGPPRAFRNIRSPKFPVNFAPVS